MTDQIDWWNQQIATFGYPLVACKHNGGPYDNEAFVAGMYTATVALRLSISTDDWDDAGMAPTRVMHQLDLVALHHGYILVHEELTDHPGWSGIGFIKMNMDDLNFEEPS